MDPAASVNTLDEVAARAVPANEVEDIGGWVARHSPGLSTKRVNSIWPRHHEQDGPLDAKLATVERFYAARGLPARFQIGPAAQPAGLDRALDRRGYTETDPTSVELCDLARLSALPCPPEATAVTIDPRPGGAQWLDTWRTARGLSDPTVVAATALFGRIRTQLAFAVVTVDGAPTAVALGVLDGTWLGIFNMATLPAGRRRGAGRAALRAFAGWAAQRGATAGYLQVNVDNPAARALYRSTGFESAYRYTYRTLEQSPPTTLPQVGRRDAPAPAWDRRVGGDGGTRLRVLHGQPGSPLGVADDRGAELRICRQAGVVGGAAEQGDEAQALLGGDVEADVPAEHVLVAAALVGVLAGPAHDLAPPSGRGPPVLGTDPTAEHGPEEVVALDEVIEHVQPALERVPAASPVVDRRRVPGICRHRPDDSEPRRAPRTAPRPAPTRARPAPGRPGQAMNTGVPTGVLA
jgi:ribosomal protein S18 acetylase RimI-like enzyme